MCERALHCCQADWDRQFYERYMQQHSAMTRWVQHLNRQATTFCHHRNQTAEYVGPELAGYYSTDLNQMYHNHEYGYPLGYTEPQHDQYQYYAREANEQVYLNDEYSSEESDVSSSGDDTSDENEATSEEEDSESVDSVIKTFEYVQLDKFKNGDVSSSGDDTSDENEATSEEEDSEIVDSVLKTFEYVQLDEFGNVPENGKRRESEPFTSRDLRNEKELRMTLYGDKADTIAGLETAISLDFNRNCDLYQPRLWPILPLRLH